jgi:hypothetical protein
MLRLRSGTAPPLFAELSARYTFVVSPTDHEQRAALWELLRALASVSPS